MSTVFLVHGGLWEPMNAERFWRTPGIVAALETHGLTVVAPDRAESPASWTDDVAVLRKYLPQEPVVVVGASNGCSAAALLAVEYPELVERLVLAWPATGGDPVVDERTKTGLLSRGDRVQLLMSC